MKKWLTFLLTLPCLLVVGCGVTPQPEEEVKYDRIPMVMVDGVLYYDSGHNSTVEGRCGVMDGEITSTVEGWETPTENDQSNFGTGYGYQLGFEEGTIEVSMNGEFRIFQRGSGQGKVLVDGQWMDAAEADPLGVTLSAKNVTSTGMTLICTQSGGGPTGELLTGQPYSIDVRTESGWEDLTALVEEMVFTMEGWMIPPGGTAEWEVSWQYLYGELPAGTYRMAKDILDLRSPGDYDKHTYYAEFTVP